MQESERVLERLAELDRDQAWLARMLGVHRIQVTRWLRLGIPASRRREVALTLHRSEAWLIVPEHPDIEHRQEKVALGVPPALTKVRRAA